MILVVDDHFDTCRVMALLFRKAGYQAECADDGYAAISKLRLMTPKVMVLDLAMAGMSGIDVLRTIRVDPDLKHLPVVVFSATNNEKEVNELHRLGIQGFLRKTRWKFVEMLDAVRPFCG